MSSAEEYLKKLLKEQEIPEQVINGLRSARDKIESLIREKSDEKNIRFYYAGSYAKETMIKESFDLDLVIYYPSTSNKSSREIHNHVRSILQSTGYNPVDKNVAIRTRWYIDHNGVRYNFHLDAVPGKAVDQSYKTANLYKFKDDKRILTSVSTHVESVKQYGHRDVIKLLKLWKTRRKIDCTTFMLELIFMRYMNGANTKSTTSEILWEIFTFIRDNIMNIRLVDPANSNNIVSDDLNRDQRNQLMNHARITREQKYWSNIFN